MGRKYAVYAANHNATNAKAGVISLAEAGLVTGTNVWTDTGAVDLYRHRFYAIGATFGGRGWTNVEEWAMHVQDRTNATTYLVCVPVDFGSAAANDLDSTLGAQLARGLYANDSEAAADKIQWMNASGGWDQAYLSLAGWYTNSAPLGRQVPPGTAFWVIRGVSNANTRANAVFTGKSFTPATVTNYLAFTTNYGGWTAFGWPLATNRWHSRAAALAGVTNQLGFALIGRGGTTANTARPDQLGDQIWLWGNNHWTNYYWLVYGTAAAYTNYNFRWWDSHVHNFADFPLEPGGGYYYWHTTNGGATNFLWRPGSP
jgi:hypothetical protein